MSDVLSPIRVILTSIEYKGFDLSRNYSIDFEILGYGNTAYLDLDEKMELIQEVEILAYTDYYDSGKLSRDAEFLEISLVPDVEVEEFLEDDFEPQEHSHGENPEKDANHKVTDYLELKLSVDPENDLSTLPIEYLPPLSVSHGGHFRIDLFGPTYQEFEVEFGISYPGIHEDANGYFRLTFGVELSRTLYLSAGHKSSALSKGTGSGIKVKYDGTTYYEGDLAIELRDGIRDDLLKIDESIDIRFDSDDMNTSKWKNYIKSRVYPFDVVAEIHFHLGTSSEDTGVRVYLPNKHTETEIGIAREVVKAVHAHLESAPNKNGTIEPGIFVAGDGGKDLPASLLRINGSNLLIEVANIGNPDEWNQYQSKKQKISELLAQAFLIAVNEPRLSGTELVIE